MEPEEPGVEEGVADVMVPVAMITLVGDVSMEVVYKVAAAAAGVVGNTGCGTEVEEVSKVEVLEVVVVEDVVDEVVKEEEVAVVGLTEVEDCWVEVATGVVEVGVVVGVVAGAEVGPGVLEFCVADVCGLEVLVTEFKTDPGKLGLKRAAKRMCLRFSKS